ncbi:MAG: hypothetical protein Q8O88_03560 [bacterium]|nr:hypothetical protein [bacterium]
MKGSDIIRHFADEDRRTDAVEELNSPAYNQQHEAVDILRNIRVNMNGRHVLVEKDFTKVKDD